jgi:hypothetical protein
MAAADYASLDDLKAHWQDLPAEREEEAAQRLREASIEIRALYPDLDGRLASGGVSGDVPRLVACRMVKRALSAADAPDQMAGLSQVSFGTGPFSFSGQVRSPDGALYLSGADKRLLSGRRERRPFTTMPAQASSWGAS